MQASATERGLCGDCAAIRSSCGRWIDSRSRNRQPGQVVQRCAKGSCSCMHGVWADDEEPAELVIDPELSHVGRWRHTKGSFGGLVTHELLAKIQGECTCDDLWILTAAVLGQEGFPSLAHRFDDCSSCRRLGVSGSIRWHIVQLLRSSGHRAGPTSTLCLDTSG